MNRQQRYEPLAQRDEPIILESITSPSYNYNSAIPNSIAPSVVSTTPGSPPPSFHTLSSPGTPRPSHSQLHHHQLQQQQQYGELWGVAPSTIGGETIDGGGLGMSSSNDTLATIKGLKQRVEWLEESMGRLLLEKEEAKNSENQPTHERNNCCVSFTDMSPDLERALLTSRGQNCLVSFSGSQSDAKRREQRLLIIALLFIAVLVCATLAVIMTAKSGKVNRAVNKAIDDVAKNLS